MSAVEVLQLAIVTLRANGYIGTAMEAAAALQVLEEKLLLSARLFDAVEKSQEILATYVHPPGPYDFARADKAISDLLGVLDAQDLVVAMRAAKA
jgi:hypothetical protein